MTKNFALIVIFNDSCQTNWIPNIFSHPYTIRLPCIPNTEFLYFLSHWTQNIYEIICEFVNSKNGYITQNLSLAVLVIYGWAIYFEYGWKVVVAYPEEDLESFSAQQSYLRFWEILIVWF